MNTKTSEALRFVFDTDQGKSRTLNVTNPVSGPAPMVLTAAAIDIIDSEVFDAGTAGKLSALGRAIHIETETLTYF